MSPDLALLCDVQRTLRLHEIKHDTDTGEVRARVIERMRALALQSAVAAMLVASAHAQPVHRHHPAADMPLHEKFYGTWYMPDQPTKSCCNKADCYPTEISYIGRQLYARRREDGKWLRIPDHKIEKQRDSPDGRNHLCAPPPNTSYPDGTVFCFALGAGI